MGDHNSVACNMGAEVVTFPQDHTTYVFCSPHTPLKYLKLLYVSANEHGMLLRFDFCHSVVGYQQGVANASLKWFC